MYKKHFGFRERPFQLVPNPAYLFLSKSHEEALAHLNYATSQGDGFVEITGEVGTGKTTLCRAFIESLDSATEVAYIFNPMLTAVELLAAVHDEFGIPSEAGGSTKALIDSLNRFLIKKKAEGKRVLLIIDEAQNLSRDVLEQVRLLSNLETNTEKLLQIILVGQPELGEMLDSFELRQLSQRITLSAHLTPLSYRDTVRYVYHRLHIASHGAKVRFSLLAFRGIYRYSRGVPRLIHIVCDRALLVAYVLNREHVTGGIVRVAIQELAGRGEWKRGGRKNFRVWAFAGILMCIAALAGGTVHWGNFSVTPSDFPVKKLFSRGEPGEIEKSTMEKGETAEPDFSPSPPVSVAAGELKTGSDAAPEPETRMPVSLPYVGRQGAFNSALFSWGAAAEVSPVIQAVRNDPGFFRAAAEQNGFEMYRLEGNLNFLFVLNLPAILSFSEPGAGSPRYLTLVRREGGKMVFFGAGEGDGVTLDAGEVAACWAGVAYIPWKNFLSCRGTIPLGTTESSVLALKELLNNIGYDGIDPGPVYDEGARAAVEAIQEKYGLPVDGIVGSLTKILLYNEQGTYNIPFLTTAPSADTPQPSTQLPTPASQLKARLN
ncbi:MAG: AAA family ATPase [Pseudomonadota bacterium]